MADPSPLRSYRAPCPGCGAPVEFRSAQSTHAVCAYCRSTVVRSGEVLSRLGKMAELFDDHSPLQLQASGSVTLQDRPRKFTLVGRLQYRAPTGTWTEWNALFDDGSTGLLGEDNGAYVFSLPASLLRDVPSADRFRVGATTAFGGKPFSVALNDQVTLIAAEGELPRLPELGRPFAMVELRSADGEVLSFDYGTQPPAVSRGRTVLLESLQLSGLRDEFVKAERGREFACPHCGAPVSVALANSRSITCNSCHSLIDLASGTGAELRHAQQDEPVQPLIALDSVGSLQGVDWQVVGFQHRLGHDPQEEDAEHFGWDEYLLYHPKRGFSFLVDTEEGWSMVKPTTGAPVLSPGAKSASYLGTTYALQYSYQAETTYVAGEFYWPVSRGQKTFNRDFAKGRGLLSMEQTPTEITWSVGSKMESDAVAKAFKLEGRKADLARADAGPTSTSGVGCGTVVVMFIVILLFLVLLRACMACDPQRENCSSSGSSWRSSGGSFGGFSSGGSHK
ncbi:MAG: DUF4178 domain-containing protein [Ramlibacter sp.]